jgi:hypothetical protein
MRRLRTLGLSLLATAAIGAVLASSAFATATTTAANWYTGSGTLLSGSATLTASASGVTKIVATIGGVPVEIQANSVSCVGCSISNSPGAHGTGKLRFSGLTLVHPTAPPCTLTDPIETAALTIEADWMEGTGALVRFIPTTGGSTGTFLTFTIGGPPASCPNGTFPIKGNLFGKTTNATGTQASNQTIQFSNAINTAAGGFFAAGGNAAELTGTDILSIGGTPFGVH